VECNAPSGGERVAHGAHQHGGIAHKHSNPAAPHGIELPVHIGREWGVHQVKHANIRVGTLVSDGALLRLTHKFWGYVEPCNAAFGADFCKE
jgi:hypothetical protein